MRTTRWPEGASPPLQIVTALTATLEEPVQVDLTTTDKDYWPASHTPGRRTSFDLPRPRAHLENGNHFLALPPQIGTPDSMMLTAARRISLLALVPGSSNNRLFHLLPYSTAFILGERLACATGETSPGQARSKPLDWMLLGFGEWADDVLYRLPLDGRFLAAVPRPVSPSPTRHTAQAWDPWKAWKRSTPSPF